MQIKNLIQDLEHLSLVGDPTTDIKGLTADSREVKPGMLFAALRGVNSDGAEYIESAIKNGAAAILVRKSYDLPDLEVPVIKCDIARSSFAHVAAKFYGKQPKHVIAVTGTSGKSSVVTFCQQLWQLLSIAGASFGTMGITTASSHEDLELTTADTVHLHKVLADLANQNISHVAMEASSHGLDQYRLDAVKLSAGAYTNLSRDHIDYHGDMKSYFEAKKILFTRVLPESCPAVLNADTPEYDDLKATCNARNQPIIDYGQTAQVLRIISFKSQQAGYQLKLQAYEKTYEIFFPLLGEFQIYNALCAAGLVISQGTKPEDVIPLLEQLKPVKGRLEVVATHPNGAIILNDYAHKPEALEKVLTVLKDTTEGKLHVVFGCGGDRDKGKRPLMGAIAERLADFAIVTDDNPRSEDPATIRQEIMQANPSATEIGDRFEAIKHAISTLQPGDTLVVAGKGHEEGQKIGDKVIPFSDSAVIQQVLSEISKDA